LKGRELFKAIASSLKAGVDMVQFRDKEASDADFFAAGLRIKKLVNNKALFIINDRVHMALALDADGVHLGQTDMPVKSARDILGRGKIIGLSANTLEEARGAEKQGADYIAIGAIFRTPVKPDCRHAGLTTLRRAAKNIKTPLVAIGGINETNITEVVSCGVKRAAVVRAILASRDPYLAAKNLLGKI